MHSFRSIHCTVLAALAFCTIAASAAPDLSQTAEADKASQSQAANNLTPAVTPAQDKAIVEAAKKQLKVFGGKTPIPGVYIAVYAPGKEPYFKGVGLADVKNKKPFEKLDRFRIGSNTKTFVVTVLLQLQDEHLLKVDDPISKYDIGVKIPNGKNITIRQLAEMRSGLFEAYDTKQFNALNIKPNTTISPNKLIEWGVSHKPVCAPGTKWNYSNTNYLILGRIIEVVTHDNVGNQIRKRLIDKMGLTATTFPDTVAMPSPYAHGYGLDKRGNWEDVSETLPPCITWAAGNMISDVPDMVKWVKAYVTGTTNSAESQKDRLKCTPISADTKMSFGMGIGHDAGWYGYTGGLPGYHTAAYYLPDKDITIVAFVTAQKEKPMPGAANVIAREISRVVTPQNIIFADTPKKKP
ncbi:MAG TPA: serine hydrolase domain-containing protein [Drouetiella sp.]|jgi:D-alanyl-D-alanine carboxypeptidase